ncbi:MAG: hypothetical protein ACR2RE_23575, partial [Geminicoccaceae bacterium]
LVLKDGRIAEVSVHTIPFPGEAVAPSSKTRKQLESFTQGIATDCFLTAQVIGHVGKGEISGRETADIHRLARARADTVQSSLINNGLPAASIASVWDWRFMVQQARVTLWVFRLTAGEDCENTPLEGQASAQVATASPETQTAVVETAPKPAVAERVEQPAPAAVQQVIPAARPKAPEPTTPVAVNTVSNKKPTKAAAPAKAKNTGKTQVAAVAPAVATDPNGSANLVDTGALEIVFATNSSYFPEGAGDQLRAFMKTLNKDQRYVLRIQTSVDGSAGVAGANSTGEAERYNAWLAERRFKRVEAWLIKNGSDRELTLEPAMIENDGSRRVRIEPQPVG